MKKQPVLHPFFFAAYTVLALLAFNIGRTPPQEALRPLFISLGITAVLLGLLKLLLQKWGKAGLLTLLYLFLLFAYGHLISIFSNHSSIGLINLHRYLTSLWAILFILGSWGIWRVLKQETPALTQFLNVLTGAALILPIYTVLTHTFQDRGIPATSDISATTATHSPHSQQPDVYFIILDEYVRSDVLATYFDYDNTWFTEALQEKGFYVAEQSTTNYSQTSATLSSILNMEYLDSLAQEMGQDSRDQTVFADLIQNSKVRAFLEGQGYQMVAISSSATPTDFLTADIYLAPGGFVPNEFEMELLKNTFPGSLFGTDVAYEIKRWRVAFAAESLKQIPEIPGPKFVFAHFYSPHLPLAFGPKGERIRFQEDDINFAPYMDETTRQRYIELYRGEVNYLNQLVLESVEAILQKSAVEPIIVLQGDHGSRAYLDSLSAENSCMFERLSILNAYYLPGDGASHLYNTITPINSFRLILDTYFGANLGLIEDEQNYFVPLNRPFYFINVTDRIHESCMAP